MLSTPIDIERSDPPLWAQHRCSVRVRLEDDCTRHDPDHEHDDDAWLRLFGEAYDPGKQLAKYDAGDTYATLMPDGRVLWQSFDGAEIRIAYIIEVIHKERP
jgi:hypothetical protein